MVFFDYEVVFTGIPKTGTSSIFTLWQTPRDNEHHHLTILEDYERYGYENVKDFYTFTIIRNPYDRFVSMAHQYFRDDTGDPTRDCNVVAKYIEGKDPYDLRCLNEMYVPQWKFICDENQNLLVNNFWHFDRLEMSYRVFAADWNKRNCERLNRQMPLRIGLENVSDARLGKKWEDEINDETISIINDVYAKDFELFGFKKIVV